MYIPKLFVATDRTEIISFMRKYSFATLVNVSNNFPSATHLPFIVKEKDSEVVLISHFAKGNTQWKQVTENDCLVIFSEPHAYISPKHYEKIENVPTWNYMAVHAYGKGRIVTDPEETSLILNETIQNFEASYQVQWDQLPEKYRNGLMNGIVAFEIKVTELQAKNKLSQNKTKMEQMNIIEALEKGDDNEKVIGQAMKKNVTAP